jgi:MFS superfamily sulfate permease-like transporter
VGRSAVPPVWLVLDASAINHLDSTAVDALEDARETLARRGISLAIAGLHSRPQAMIERSGLAARVGLEMIFPSAEDAADAFQVLVRSDLPENQWTGRASQDGS